MGGDRFSEEKYADRATTRAFTGRPVFSYTADIAEGRAERKVHPTFDPFGVKIRESRDSDVNPVTVPIAWIEDVTGSMMQVPGIYQSKLPKLFDGLMKEVNGKKALGNGYPAIMLSAVDDYEAVGRNCFQFGQFESGIQVDEALENLWLTGAGGGSYQESYEIALYALAKHTAHDHMAKRNRKGYAFITGDEMAYDAVSAKQVNAIFGDGLQADIPFDDILVLARDLYEVFFIIPALSSHYADPKLEKWWQVRLGQQNVIKLDDPTNIVDCIVEAVTTRENYLNTVEA